jgi:hypothetical protein
MTDHKTGTREEWLAAGGLKKGKLVVSVLNDPKYAEGFAFGLKGDTGISMLEGAAA